MCSDVPSCEQQVLHWAIALDHDVGFFAAAANPTASESSAAAAGANVSLKNDFLTRLRLFLQVPLSAGSAYFVHLLVIF